MAEQLKMNSYTGEIRPEVSLVSSTSNPVGTIFALWYGSRSSDSVDAEVVQKLYDDPQYTETWYDNWKNNLKDVAPDDEHRMMFETAERIIDRFPDHSGDNKNDIKSVIRETVKLVLKLDLPPAESVNFTFCVDNASVAWREQLVRSKLASYWMQTSRTTDIRTMDISMNKSVELLGGEEAVGIYKDTAQTIREAYIRLMELGVPAEDIRLQPQMYTHRVYWMIDLRALLKVIHKRVDWIAQGSLWTPIVAGVMKVIHELGLYDIVKQFIGKPNVTIDYDVDWDDYHVIDYPSAIEMEDRMKGIDPLPVDPLYLAYTHKSMPEFTDLEFYDYMKSMFIQIWDDDILTVLGWDRNDPSKLGYYDRPLNSK